MVDTSPGRLDAIEQLEPAQRGTALEHFVADLFRHEHFSVRHNAGAARPRQTDVFVSRTTETYLVECKWRSDKADIDDFRTDEPVTRHHAANLYADVTPIHYFVAPSPLLDDRDADWVTGIVIDNPLHDPQRGTPQSASLMGSTGSGIANSSSAPCETTTRTRTDATTPTA